MFKKMIAIILTVLILCAMVAGCSAETPQEVVEDERHTSEELDLYAFGEEVYNSAGELVAGYAVDEDDNIVDADGMIVVHKEDVLPYLYITEAVVDDKESLEQKIVAERIDGDQIATKAATFTLTFRATPLSAFRKILVVESEDPGAVYFPFEENKDILTGDVEEPEDGALPAVSAVLDENGEVEITVVGCFDGSFKLTARNEFGAAVGEFDLTLTPEYVEDTDAETDGDEPSEGSAPADEEHEHVFADTVVAPTATAQGYTTHRCTICGYTFRDTYTDKLPCQHQYVDTVVPATYAAGGYTLHRCTICGESYRDNETAPLTCGHAHTTSAVVNPTCTEQGYTMHECADCHSYSFLDTYVSALGHSWDGGTVTTAATCGASGAKTLTCTRCGATTTEVIPATGAHTYTDQVVAPTCTEAGYTLHTCSVCGASQKDAGAAALGHDYQEHTERVQTGMEAHHVCSCCGMDFTAAGYIQSQVGEHIENHVLNDLDKPGAGAYHSVAVPVYEEMTTYICVRCGSARS